MQKRRPDRGGADLHCGDRRSPTKSTLLVQSIDDLARYRALALMARFRIDPALAAALAALAFGGAA